MVSSVAISHSDLVVQVFKPGHYHSHIGMSTGTEEALACGALA